VWITTQNRWKTMVDCGHPCGLAGHAVTGGVEIRDDLGDSPRTASGPSTIRPRRAPEPPVAGPPFHPDRPPGRRTAASATVHRIHTMNTVMTG